MRQLDELLDEILQVRDERAEDVDGPVATGNGSAAKANGSIAVAEPDGAPQEHAQEWESSGETWAETEEYPAEETTESYAEPRTHPEPEPYAPVPSHEKPQTPVEPQAYAQPQGYADPASYAEPASWAPEVPVEDGPPVEEALADAWDGTFDVPEGGWEAESAPTTDQWAAPSTDRGAPPTPPPPAHDWTAVEAAAAAPVAPASPPAPVIPVAPAAPPETLARIAPQPVADLWAAETRTGPEPAVSSWVDVTPSTYARTRSPAGASVEVPAPALVPAPRRTRGRGSRRERPARRRALRAVGVAGLVLAVAAASLWTITALRSGPASRPAPPAARGVGQQVVVWTVWDERPGGPAFVSVLASGGGFDPVLMAVPPKTVVTAPGRGYQPIGETAAVGSADAVAAAVENILGVKVDAATGMPLASLAPLVDRIGGIEVEDPEDFGVVDPRLNGEQTVEYLRASDAGSGEAGDDTRFIRWLEVTTAIVTKAYEKPGILEEIPPAHRPVFVAAGSGRTEVFDLPVEAIGAGLARPDPEEIPRLVGEYFLTSIQTDRVVRIVVMNGNGRPGTGQTVARLLVPAGFRLVSSLNAPNFNVETTRIVAGSEEFLDEAYLAQRLLGVGEVFFVEQESHVADLSIQVGKDFLRR